MSNQAEIMKNELSDNGIDSAQINNQCLRDAQPRLGLLVNVIDQNLGGLLTIRKVIAKKRLKKTRFEHLWHLYKPESLIATSKHPHQVYRLIHLSGGRSLMVTQELSDVNLDTLKENRVRKSEVTPFKIDSKGQPLPTAENVTKTSA